MSRLGALSASRFGRALVLVLALRGAWPAAVAHAQTNQGAPDSLAYSGMMAADSPGAFRLSRPSEPGRGSIAGSSSAPLGRGLSMGLVLGMYVGLNLLAYLAWWADSPPDHFEWKHEGWFGAQTYAGGADKLGHLFMNHFLTRATAGLLTEGGFNRRASTFAGACLSLGTYYVFEMRDGYSTGFSETDVIGNLAGAAMGILMREVPVVDELFDTRVEYVPSPGYSKNFKKEGFNFNEDYTGLTFLFAWHLASLPWVEQKGGPLRFLDAVVGYNAHNYRPKPVDPNVVRTQHSFFGLSLNVGRLIDEIWLGQRHPKYGASASRGHRLTQFGAEFFNLPFTSVPLVSWKHESRKCAEGSCP
jgi:hypothetical protein